MRASLVRSTQRRGIEGQQVEQVVDVERRERAALLLADALETADVDVGERPKRERWSLDAEEVRVQRLSAGCTSTATSPR